MKALERKKNKNAEEVEKNNVIEEITVQEEKMEQFACKQETIGDKAYKKISTDKKVKHKERNEHHKSKQNIEMSEDDGLKQAEDFKPIIMEPGTWNKKRPFMDFWQEEVARRLVGLREMEAEEMRKIWRLQVMFIFDVWNDGMFIYGALCCPYLFNNCYSYRAAARAVPATQNTK